MSGIQPANLHLIEFDAEATQYLASQKALQLLGNSLLPSVLSRV